MSRGYESLEDEAPVTLSTTFESTIIVDGLPQISMDKYQKLQQHIRKTFSAVGPLSEDGLLLPVTNSPTEPSMTKGYAFIEYESPESAQRAVIEFDGKKMDARHTFRVCLFEDYDKYMGMSETYTPPEKKDFDSKANLGSWLLDPLGRDQYVVRYGFETQIFWNDPLREAGSLGRKLKYGGEREKQKGKNWTERQVAWSPRGSYLVTFHDQGAALWGGDDFERLGRLLHPGVRYIDFSPNERYVVTSTGEDKKQKTDPDCIIVFDTKRCEDLRHFDKGLSNAWPAFRWSHDDKYFARITEAPVPDRKDKGPTDLWKNLQISVYETPSMTLLDRRSIRVEGVQEVQWSPSENIISYWVPERDPMPAKVALIEIPSRRLVREKHMYNVQDISMHWQSNGDYMAVKVNRRKGKKFIGGNIEIYSMREKDIPVEVKEFPEPVLGFAWEPSGNRFAVIHGENPGRCNFTFFVVRKNKLKQLETFADREMNTIFWAPKGGMAVLAGLGSLSGQLEFIDLSTAKAQSIAVTEHSKCTDVEWDPSGRYCVTSSLMPMNNEQSWKYSGFEYTYRLYNRLGELQVTVPYEQLYQFIWRPRPPTLIASEKEKEIKKTLKEKYWRQFETEDEKLLTATRRGAARERAEMRAEWRRYREERDREYREEALARAELRGGLDSDEEDDWVTMEMEVDEEISRTEEAMRGFDRSRIVSSPPPPLHDD